ADPPPDPGAPFAAGDAEWIGAVSNGLDVDYQWLYDDGPGSGVSGCQGSDHSECWADRHIALDAFGAGVVVMGAALNPTADKGGPSLAVTITTTPTRPSDLGFTWDQAVQAAA